MKYFLISFYVVSLLMHIHYLKDPKSLDKASMEFLNWKFNEDKTLFKTRKLSKASTSWTQEDLRFLSLDFDDFIPHDTIRGFHRIAQNLNFPAMQLRMSQVLDSSYHWNKSDFSKVKLIEPLGSQELKKKDAYLSYALPIVSDDGSFVFFSYSYKCGVLCASYRKTLYRKTQNGYEVVAVYYRAEA